MRSFVSITILSLLYGIHAAPLTSRPSIRASSVDTTLPARSELRPELLKFRRLATRQHFDGAANDNSIVSAAAARAEEDTDSDVLGADDAADINSGAGANDAEEVEDPNAGDLIDVGEDAADAEAEATADTGADAATDGDILTGSDGDDEIAGGAGSDVLGLFGFGSAAASTGPRTTINAATLTMVKSFEGFEPSPKKDPVGLFTVGFGHKCLDQRNAKCAEVPFTFPLSRANADALILSDMQEGIDCVNNEVNVPLNENQFGALASFSFNGGCGLLRSSTLLKRLNAGEDPNTVAAAELPKFNKGTDPVTKKKFVLNGLTRRRAAEVALFTS